MEAKDHHQHPVSGCFVVPGAAQCGWRPVPDCSGARLESPCLAFSLSVTWFGLLVDLIVTCCWHCPPTHVTLR